MVVYICNPRNTGDRGRRITFKAVPIWKITKAKRAVVQHLLSKHEALSSKDQYY
jgi:hypothetical protein